MKDRFSRDLPLFSFGHKLFAWPATKHKANVLNQTQIIPRLIPEILLFLPLFFTLKANNEFIFKSNTLKFNAQFISNLYLNLLLPEIGSSTAKTMIYNWGQFSFDYPQIEIRSRSQSVERNPPPAEFYQNNYSHHNRESAEARKSFLKSQTDQNGCQSIIAEFRLKISEVCLLVSIVSSLVLSRVCLCLSLESDSLYFIRSRSKLTSSFISLQRPQQEIVKKMQNWSRSIMQSSID